MSTARRTPKVVSALSAMILGCYGGLLSAAEGDWEWSAAIYAWMASLNSELSVNGHKIAETDLSFSDILDNLDATLMVHGEGFRDQWGFFADLNYLNISDKETRTLATVDMSSKSTILDLAGVYRPSGKAEGFEAFAGLRYFKMDIRFDVTTSAHTTRTRTDDSYTDFLVGARYTGLINDNWFYRLRADASGGDTDGTWSLLASAGYRFGDDLNKSVLFGYRHMQIDLENDRGAGTVGNDMTFSGPFVAFNYAF